MAAAGGELPGGDPGPRLDWEAALAALPEALRPPPAAPRLRGELAGHLALSGPLRRPSAWRVEAEVDTTALAALPPGRGRAGARPAVHLARPTPGRRRAGGCGRAGEPCLRRALEPAPLRVAGRRPERGRRLLRPPRVRRARDAGRARAPRGPRPAPRRLHPHPAAGEEPVPLAASGRSPARCARRSPRSRSRHRRASAACSNCTSPSPSGAPACTGSARPRTTGSGRRRATSSPEEAAFLATVIPNPVRYELYRRRGGLTERWDERVRDLLLKLRAADVLTDEEFFEAWYAPLGFRRS